MRIALSKALSKMKRNADDIRLSATDLSNHLMCRHLTALDLEVAIGAPAAATWNSPDAWVLQQRGMEHEKAYLEYLNTSGVSITDLRDIADESTALEQTLCAMKLGAAAIAQATLERGRWFGGADVLRRVERPSRLAPP